MSEVQLLSGPATCSFQVNCKNKESVLLVVVDAKLMAQNERLTLEFNSRAEVVLEERADQPTGVISLAPRHLSPHHQTSRVKPRRRKMWYLSQSFDAVGVLRQ